MTNTSKTGEQKKERHDSFFFTVSKRTRFTVLINGVRSPVSRVKARAEGGFGGGGSDDTTTNALWNALTERNENENVMGRRIQLPPKNFANNNNNKKSFDEKNTKKKVKEREAKKDGLSLRSMAVVPVVRFGVVEITKSAEERVKIVNDTNRNGKMQYRFEGEEKRRIHFGGNCKGCEKTKK